MGGAKLHLSIFLLFTGFLGAQCIVNNPGGSKINPNRPSDSDTPDARFSPLSVLNRNLPAWLCFTAGYRTRFEANNSDSYLLTRFRLGMLLKPVNGFQVYTELQDTDAFFKAPPRTPPYQETWDLRRAYVDIGNVQEGHLGIRAGRQDLTFEDGRLVGTSYWRNASRGFDAVEAVSNWTGINATAFAASPVVIFDNGLSHHQSGNNLYGLDAKLNRLAPNSVIEPFLFWRVAPDHVDEKTFGARFAGTVRTHWDFDAEGAGQFGTMGPDRLRAWAWLAIGGYTFTNLPLKTRLFGEYDFASGDRNSKDGVHGTFDQIAPNVHDHLGLADQFAWQNLKMLRAGVRVWLRRNWVAAGAWQNYWLTSPNDAFYNSSGAIVARDSRGISGSHIAEEYDIQASYRLDRNLEFGAGLGRVLPGNFLANTGHGSALTYPYLLMSYNFF
jgi:hypothetical protein